MSRIELKGATRREFLRRSAALAGLGAGAPLALNLAALNAASAASPGGYRALVCVFLNGGNDAYNTVLATDPDSWSLYQTVRDQQPESIALMAPGTPVDHGAERGSPRRLGGALAISPIRSQGRSFALHPVMHQTRELFAARRLAIVSNVGPLLRPMTKADWFSTRTRKPANLFSHNDQQSTWQTMGTEGTQVGWGGRLADMMASGNQHAIFSAVSASGNAAWLAGNDVTQFQLAPTGALAVGSVAGWLFGSATVHDTLRNVMRTSRETSFLGRDHAAVSARSIDSQAMISSALPPASQAPFGSSTVASSDPVLQYDSPASGARQLNPLAQQLQVVARMIAARGSLGANRQVFFVNLSGFDTHDNQNADHAELMARLSHGLGYFDDVLGALGQRDSVTTFTASDFGRTFTNNGDGSDHGWGGHHLVMGGAVRGGDIYGNFPAFGLPDGWNDFSSPNQIGNGSLLPEISVDQYGATLARWFGASDSQVLDVFPNLGSFNSSQRDLGFMG